MLLVKSDGLECKCPLAICLKLSLTWIYHHNTRKQQLGKKKKKKEKGYGEWWELEGNSKWLKRNAKVKTILLNISGQSPVQRYAPPYSGRELSQCTHNLSNYNLWQNVAYTSLPLLFYDLKKMDVSWTEGLLIKCNVGWLQSHTRSKAGQENIHVWIILDINWIGSAFQQDLWFVVT